MTAQDSSTHTGSSSPTRTGMSYISPALRSLAMPVVQMKVLEGNPRKGHVEDIAKSLAAHGQQKPVVVLFLSNENASTF